MSSDAGITQDGINDENIDDHGKKSKKTRSEIYENFSFNKETSRWDCKFCRKNFSDSSNTSLWRHTESEHPTKLPESRKNTNDNGGNSRNLIDNYINPAEKFSQEKFASKLRQWIVIDDQPFLAVERKEFVNLLKFLRPSIQIPSSDTLKRDISQDFQKTKEIIRQELQEAPGMLSFTIDAWTSQNQLPFLGISVHWIDKKWELKCTTLDFCVLSGPHTGENLSQKFSDVLDEFNITTKLLAIACDNASNMNTMLEKLSESLADQGVFFDSYNQRVRCLAHVINLAARSALENLHASGFDDINEILESEDTTSKLDNVMYKLRKLVVKIRASPQRRERFKQQCNAVNLSPLELISDIKTRWNSTNTMIERAIFLRQALHNISSSDRDLKVYTLSDDEWDRVIAIQGLMKHFAKATDFIVGQTYPTLAFSVPVYNFLLNKIEDEVENSTIYEIKKAAKAAETKIKEYYPYTDGRVYIISTIMDPRLKLNYYEENDWEDEYVKEAKEVITQIWEDEYKKVNSVNEDSEIEDELFSHFFKKRKVSQKDELKEYLKEPVIPYSTDILVWWKLRELDYPNLSKMARDYLAIPGTSAPVERIFSGGTDLVVQKRCSLKSETIREVMCLKGWWKSGFNKTEKNNDIIL